MDIFELRQKTLEDYDFYVRSFLKICNPETRKYVEEEFAQGAFWPDALIQLNPAYETGPDVKELVQQSMIHPLCEKIFCKGKKKKSFVLYQHQYQAILAAIRKDSYVLTSGTGSGKSLAYLIPIFDHILKHEPEKTQVHAVIVYPMNALVNSQKEDIQKLLGNLSESEQILRVAAYTGQEKDEEKSRLQQSPPHVLLTNYVMLELMLERPLESIFVERGKSALHFLVIDELHTYRGRQGADVAMLIRRLRERCGNSNLLCIGTSATMATGPCREERRKGIAVFASQIFGMEVKPDNVIEETLRRIIPRPRKTNQEELRQAIQKSVETTNWPVFVKNPLSSWIEDHFGVIEEPDGHLRRCVPITLEAGASQLQQESGEEKTLCLQKLKEMLLVGSKILTPEKFPCFVFKLHQFVALGSSVYSTLEPQDRRYMTMEAQFYAPDGEKRILYPLLFCRCCGQEYAKVTWNQNNGTLTPGGSGDDYNLSEEETGSIISGYVMLDTQQRWQGKEEDLPDHWSNPSGRLKPEYREYCP